jgi:hypothetical protein
VGGGVAEHVLTVGILEGQKLYVGIGIQDLGHAYQLTVHTGGDVGAGDQLGGGCGVKDGQGGVEIHRLFFEIDLHGFISSIFYS